MNLQKFFRRNARMLLMVFMSLLLVAFLVPEAVNGCKNQQQVNQVLGEAFGKRITNADLARTVSDLHVIDALHLRRPEDMAGLPRLDDRDAHLLAEEARRMGVRVTHADAENFLARIQIDANVIAMLGQQINRSRDAILDSVAQWMAVQKVIGLQFEAVTASAPRAEQRFSEDTQQAEFKASVLDAQAFLGQVPEPTEQELTEQFEAGKNRDPAHSENELSFGYKLPDRVAIEYITIDPAKMEPRVQVREGEAKEHYETNKSKYVERIPIPTTQTSQPVKPQFETRQLTYEQAKDAVKRDKRRLKAIAEAQRIMNDLERKARETWNDAEIGKDGFRVPPPGAAAASLEALQKDPKSPIDYHKTGLLDRRELQSQPGIGFSANTSGGSRVGFPQMALSVKGLRDSADQTHGLNAFEPSPLLMSMGLGATPGKQIPTQAFIFRVIENAPSGPPASLDAVRERVARDVKLKKAFAMAQEYAHKLEMRATEVGLATAVNEDAALRQILDAADAVASSQPSVAIQRTTYAKQVGPNPATKFTPSAPSVPFVGLSRGLGRKLFEVGAASGSSKPAHQVVVVAAADRQKWIVAELERIQPLYADDFKDKRQQYDQLTARTELEELQQSWLDPDNIHKRTGFVSSLRKSGESSAD